VEDGVADPVHGPRGLHAVVERVRVLDASVIEQLEAQLTVDHHALRLTSIPEHVNALGES
jgi:hypothetical protein